MNNRRLAERLVAALPAGLPGLFNPWRDLCTDDTPSNGPAAKLERLAAHLSCEPRFVLCGEAAGWQGKRHTGLAFTSERLLLEGCIPRIDRPDHRLTTRRLPCSEPSATIVWKTLYRLGMAEETVLWNALPLHPHEPDDGRTNRTPTDRELALGVDAMDLLISACPGATLIAVGRKAERLLGRMGKRIDAAVRHPANGGASAFAEGLMALRAHAAWTGERR